MLLDYREDIGSHARALELVAGFRNVRHPVLLDTLGWAYYRNERFLDAVRFLEMAVAGAGQNAEMRYHLGMAYNATQNPVGAKEELITAIQIAEKDELQEFVEIEIARETLDSLNQASSSSG
jgi:Flp pilus assembly protein TadD